MEQFKSSLPAGVLALQVNDDFGETAAIRLRWNLTKNLSGTGTLPLEDKLRTVPDAVANLRRYGLQKEQISVYLIKKEAEHAAALTQIPWAELSRGASPPIEWRGR